MSYQQPPSPQGPPPGAPMGAPPPGAPSQRNSKALIGAVLVTLALILMFVALLSHSWLSPKKEPPGDMFMGLGLWSTLAEMGDESESTSHLEALDEDPGNAFTMFAVGSIAFFALNWILFILLGLAAGLGFARFASGKSAGAPFILSMITSIASVLFFMLWFFVAVIGSDAFDDLKLGGSVYLWWVGPILTIAATVLFGMARQRTFGHGFQGSAGMMPPGQGIIGGPPPGAPGAAGPPGMMPPGQGIIGSPPGTPGPG